MTRSRINEEICLISHVKPRRVDQEIKDDHQIKAMEEELQWIIKNDTWESVPRPKERKCDWH